MLIISTLEICSGKKKKKKMRIRNPKKLIMAISFKVIAIMFVFPFLHLLEDPNCNMFDYILFIIKYDKYETKMTTDSPTQKKAPAF